MRRKINILDNMVLLLEKHASNLEDIVEVRTRELVEEKSKTESLLYRMLPRYACALRVVAAVYDTMMCRSPGVQCTSSFWMIWWSGGRGGSLSNDEALCINTSYIHFAQCLTVGWHTCAM